MHVEKDVSRVVTIAEVYSDATVAALNSALAKHHVSPERIIAIHYLEGVYVANGRGPQFRVLYRA